MGKFSPNCLDKKSRLHLEGLNALLKGKVEIAGRSWGTAPAAR
jgi:hypothetical protein